MITPIQMYWLTRLDGINSALFLLVAALSVAIIGMVLVGIALRDTYLCNSEEHATGKKLHKVAVRLICPWLLSLVCLVLVPTTKEAAAIIVVPAVANSEKVQEAGNKLYSLAVEWMDELRPTTKQEEEANESK